MLLRLVIILATTAPFLGLGVLGWGGFIPFFSHPARIALVIISAILAVASAFSAGNLSSGEREDRQNRWVILALLLISLVMAYVPAYADRKNIWTLDGDAVRWLGVVLFTVGGVLRLVPVFVLGWRFSGLVAIQQGHTLVTNGIYRFIRHPSYLGLLINALGCVLVFRSAIGLILVALLVIPLVARMNAEEALLRTAFGREYNAYCARTSRLIPGVY